MPIRCLACAWRTLLALGLLPCLAGDTPSESWDLGGVDAGSIVRRDFPLADGGDSIRGFSVSGADARIRWQTSKDRVDEWTLVVEVSVPPTPGPFRGIVSLESSSGGDVRIEFQGTSLAGPSDPQVLKSDSYRLAVSARPELTPGGGGEPVPAGRNPWVWGLLGLTVGGALVAAAFRAFRTTSAGSDRNSREERGAR